MEDVDRAVQTKAILLKETFTSTMWNFMMNTTLHGYRHIAELDRHWLERIVWVVIQMLATWAVVSTILGVYFGYLDTPTATTIQSSQYPIWNIPFPAVAICDVNKISKSKARKLASKLEKNTNYTEKELFGLLRYVGRMYDHQMQGYDSTKELHRVLTNFQRNYSIGAILKDLSPSCEDTLVRCMWRGKTEPCENIFRKISTLQGFCCVFNMPGGNGTSKQTAPRRLISAGVKMGLNLLLNIHPEDYYYPTIPAYGLQMLVFKPKDRPDTPSGVLEKLVTYNTEIFFTLTASSRYSVSDLRAIDAKSRGCLFESEAAKIIPGVDYYSFGRCLSKCSTSSMIRLCSCLPFYFGVSESFRTCGLQDLQCLLKNKEKLQNHRLRGWGEAREETGDTSFCEDCLPSCSDTSYNIQSSYGKIGLPSYHRSKLTDGIKLHKNHSILHLYYSNTDTLLYKQDILYSWYELLSNFGGICSLFNGFSFISIIEFLYFFTFRGFFISKEKKATVTSARSEDSEFVPEAKSPRFGSSRPIYINEMRPRY